MTRRRMKKCGAILLLTVLFGCSRSPEARRAEFLARGKEFLQKGDYSRALLDFRNAARAVPKDAEIHYQIGLANLAAGDVRMAVAGFRRAVELNAKHIGAQLKLAQLMTASGDDALLKDAENLLKELMEGSAATAEMLNTLALTELRLGKTGNAVHNLEQALSKAPQELNSSIQLAQAKLLQKDVKGAEEVLKKACTAAPNAAEPRVILGRFYISQNRPTDAEAAFQQALKIDSKSGEALLDLASLQNSLGRKQEAEENFKRVAGLGNVYKPMYALFLFQNGRRDEAIREFEKLAKENPEDRQARTRLVRAYQAANRVRDAERVLAAALAKDGKDLDALLQRGELFLAAGKYEDAEAEMNRVVHLKPDSAEVRYILAKLYQARGTTLRYKQELFEALNLNQYLLPVRLEIAQVLVAANQAKTALSILDASPDSQKQSMPLLIERNWTLWAMGDLAEMRKGIDLGLSRERQPALLVQDGVWKLRQGNSSGARAALEEALKIDPTDIRALEGLRQTYMAQKQHPLALQKVKEYAAKQPQSAPVQQFLGTLLLANGEKEQARVAFTTARALDPQFAPADLSLVQMAVLDGKWEDARNRLREIVSANNGQTLARLWLGNVELVTGNHPAAVDHYRKVLDAQPENADALNNLAYLLALDANRLDEALGYAEKALEQAPANPEIADTLGWICYRKGLYTVAIQHLEPAASKSDNAACKYHLAMAYAKAGDVKRGKTALLDARKANPNLPEAAEAVKLFAEVQ